MASADERTPLLNDEANLRSDVSPPRLYQKQNRAFHLIALIGLILVFVIAAFATVWFSFLSKPSDTVVSQANESLRQLKNISWPRPDTEVVGVSFSPQILAVIEEAVDDGKEEFENKENIESKIKPIDFRSASYKHQRAIVYSPDSYNVSKYGYIENHATKYLRNKGYTYVIDYKSATNFKWSSESKCNLLNDNLKCNISKYRSIDGSCNNLDHPRTWGVAMTPFRRSLPANYNDGVSEPRGGFVSSLPSARDISTHVHRAVHKEDINFSVMLAVWGQFIDHDITATALSRGANGNTISCCNTEFKHPECFPVLLNKDDEYYSKFNLSCMEFVRSAPALRCSFGPREQLNQASSYFDGSMIYGNTENLSKRLRTYEGGRLEMSYTKDGRSLLPFSKDPIDGCNHIEEIKKGRYCFLSGDARANENSHLTSIHLIFARQHNEIVKQLSLINPRWDDEILYQEARRIVAAQVQHITYNEFLPIIIGSDLMNTLKLYSQTSGFWTNYNSMIDVTISNNFAASSFRFAHTLIPRLMKVLSNDTVSPEYVEMHQMLFNPFRLYEGDLDAIIRGAMNTDIERADNYFTDQLTNRLFESHEKTNKSINVGLDLVSLNIQRGRDHGLPSYPYWREYCGFSRVTTFEELITIFDEDSFKTVTKIYKSVEEIDLYTGSLSEIPIEGGLVGPTITCLIADQFYRLKYGDRFWYETNEEPQAFTEEQLNEIRKTSLAGIICQNADDLKLITPQVMRSASEKNEHTLCSNIAQPDLTKFKDLTFTADDVLPQKIIDLEIKSNIINSSWKGGLNISNNYIDDLIKHGISWKGVVSSDYPETRIKGNFSLPFEKNKTEGQFDVKFHNLDGELYIPSDIEIWSPVYVENKTNTSFSENHHFIPLILHGNRTADGFQWNGNFNVLIGANQKKEINEEKVEYLPESNSDFEKSKRGEADSQSDYVDKQMLDDLIKKVRNENGNDSSAIRYLDSILIPSGDVSQHKIDDLEIKSNNFNSSWKGGLNISNNYIDDLIKHGISWKGVVSSDYPETRIKGNFSLPFEKNKTEGQFDVKFHNLDGELYIPSDIEIWSPVYVENKTNTSFSENHHVIPLILHGNRTVDGFQWNGNFNALMGANQQNELNTEKVEYLPESTSDFEESKRAESDSQTNYVDKQMLDDLIKKIRNESANDSSAIRYLDSILKHDDLNVTEKSDESEERKIKAILTEIFKSKSLMFSLSSEENATINNITFVSKNILEHIRNYTSKDNLTDIIFKWKWEPEGKLLRWEVLGNSTNNFTIKYEEMKGCCLKTNCTYYSKFAFKPDFNLTADVEPNACTVIAPIVVDEDTWPLIHNITVAIRKLDPNLEKEEEMSLKPIREKKQTFDHFEGVVSMSVDNELVTLWNGTLPAQFGTKWSWMRNNNTAAYPVAWSGIKINAFVGNFMFPEKINNSIVWHDGQFSFIIDDNVTIPDSIEVYYSILYLTTLDDIVPSNLSDVEEYTDWELNRFSRIILKGEFINDIFYWYGKITFIITDYNDYSNLKAVSYRPSIRYTGHIVGGMLYAKFNNKTDLWWSGILPSTVLVPVNISRGCKQVFDQVIVWNLTSTNDSFGHISFFTYSNDSRISLLGELDARLTAVLISSPLKINVTYYSPILLQEQKFDLTDDLSEMYRENSYGIFAPITLIGKYYRRNAMFAWNGKFIISSFEN